MSFSGTVRQKKIQWKIVEIFAEGIEINGGIDFCEKPWKLLSFFDLRFFSELLSL